MVLSCEELMKLVISAVTLLLTFAPALAQATRPTVWIIGDSTVRNGTKGPQGWGDPIKAMFDQDKVRVENRAIGGRSSRTFRTEGRWEQVLKDAKPGDFVLMQFGHNDSGPLVGYDRERGSIRGEGDETEDVTKKNGAKESVHSFGWYMRQYVKESKDAGLTPIVCSYVPRCPKPDPKNPGAKVEKPSGLGGYALWSKNAADAGGAEFIDLQKLIATRYVGRTPEEIKKQWFSDADFTHTNVEGAKLDAECVVDGIRSLKDCRLASFLATQGKQR
jgi:lysophospholipase L1-like esterase